MNAYDVASACNSLMLLNPVVVYFYTSFLFVTYTLQCMCAYIALHSGWLCGLQMHCGWIEWPIGERMHSCLGHLVLDSTCNVLQKMETPLIAEL